MITGLYLLTGYIFIGYLIALLVSSWARKENIKPPKGMTEVEFTAITVLCWLPMIILGLLFPSNFEEK